MKYKNIQNKLLRYVDGPISTKERQKIQHHLDHCEKCRKEVELLSQVWNLTKPMQRAQPSPFLWNKILSRLSDKTQKELWVYKAAVFIRHTIRPALTVATVTLTLFVGIQIGNHLVTENVSRRQATITMTGTYDEFGVDNFQLFSSGSLDDELEALMDYKNK